MWFSWVVRYGIVAVVLLMLLSVNFAEVLTG
jgi:hypothetical protein